MNDKKAVVGLARELAQSFSKRAGESDRRGEFSRENLQELKDSGLLTLLVPERLGGMGGNFSDHTAVVSTLATGDASTALGYCMHNIVTGQMAEVEKDAPSPEGTRGRKIHDCIQWVCEEAKAGKVFASANSEPSIGATLSKLTTTYTKVDGGYVLNGHKNWVSMGGHADYYVVSAKSSDSTPDQPLVTYFFVPHDNPGIRFEFTWDVLGMRATSTNPMYLEECRVPPETLFLGMEGLPPHYHYKAPHWGYSCYMGVYLGIAQAAFDFMVGYLSDKKKKGTAELRRDDSYVQHKVGELYAELLAARRVLFDAADRVSADPGTYETNEAVHLAKYVVSEVGPKLTSEAIRLCGGSTIARRYPLERFYRESRCGGLMPASSDDCLTYLGRAALGFDKARLGSVYL